MAISRRQFCLSLAAAAMANNSQVVRAVSSDAIPDDSRIYRTIPSSGEKIPCIGMGSWITFDVAYNEAQWMQRVQVLKTFFEMSGAFIDSSPMYGYAEEVIGFCLKSLEAKDQAFAASKIWTPAAFEGSAQMNNSEDLWGKKPMDLMFVHNLLGIKKHLPKLREWKQSGRIRYLGLSTSHGRRHAELEHLLKSEVLDFVQLTLNIEQTQTEKVLLPLAADRGVAVVVNRPFQRGALFKRYAQFPLPAIASELGCQNWAQFFLLYITSHPAVTCVIPATSQVSHMQENMGALHLTVSDEKIRFAMRDSVQRL